MLAWVKHSIFQTMSEQATHCQPYETGGCLLGYWVKPLEEVVICGIIGPGPKAKHSKNKFVLMMSGNHLKLLKYILIQDTWFLI